jgi:Na+-driven multidrug efflux pump
MFLSTYIVDFFAKGNFELIDIGSRAIRIYLLMLPFLGYQIVNAAYFQAIGKAKNAMILTVTRQVVFLIPAILILPQFFNLDGVWMAGPVADSMSAILSAIFLYNELRILKKLERENIIFSS